ncbi:type II toxin-antitoxin system RatA family toxin [Pseudohongiella spirulinae]|uniref:Oligoketide cyclase/lipid transport protein n=1 Tax=Pseudohongiella spirulinae TaxID=1249552 RepID=A0A0S2KG28_9GAMM|nr:type II toxin-antitoxin system RatA family toxin [Pseudohongiella spirulinae]ALO47141.1 Oligoketide cyclase/lipid transport protein [Pseudohongiella spirulinae]
MVTIERSALVNYSAGQMYALIDDIEQYPTFMQGCIKAEVLERTATQVTGRLTLGKAGLKYNFTTRNSVVPGRSMDMELLDGPFKSFDATWHFKPLSETACKVSLVMHFEWAGGFLGAAMEKLFQHSANSLVDALVDRAGKLYG